MRLSSSPARSARVLVAFAVAVLCLSSAPGAGAATKTMAVQPGGSAWLSDGSPFADGGARSTITLPSSTARPLRLALQFRGVTGHDGYRTTLAVDPAGASTLIVSRINADKEVTLTSVALPAGLSTGDSVNLEGSIAGTSPVVLRARAWTSGAVPGWQAQVQDSDTRRLVGVQSPAKVGLMLGSSAKSGFSGALSVSTGPTPTGTTLPATQLSASDVGVPAGAQLSSVYGDITVTKAGTVLSDLDVHGFVIVRAPNVTIRRSLVRGGPAKSYHLGLVTSVGQQGTLIEDSTLRADTPSVMVDGVLGDNYTLRRVLVTGGVDNVKVQGDNVRVERSRLERLDHFDHDPSQNGGATHNDSIQILKGQNIVVTGSTAIASDNFALLGGAEWGDISLTATNNYLDGGHCNAKLQIRNGHALQATVKDNVFGPHRTEQSCPFVAEKTVSLVQSGNVLSLDGAPVNALRI